MTTELTGKNYDLHAAQSEAHFKGDHVHKFVSKKPSVVSEANAQPFVDNLAYMDR